MDRGFGMIRRRLHLLVQGLLLLRGFLPPPPHSFPLPCSLLSPLLVPSLPPAPPVLPRGPASEAKLTTGQFTPRILARHSPLKRFYASLQRVDFLACYYLREYLKDEPIKLIYPEYIRRVRSSCMYINYKNFFHLSVDWAASLI